MTLSGTATALGPHPRAEYSVAAELEPFMSRVCRFVMTVFAALVAVALVLFVIGTYGWFGSPQGPLAGVLLVPLGMPWVLLLDVLPEPVLAAAAAAAPALNLLLIWTLCRRRARA